MANLLSRLRGTEARSNVGTWSMTDYVQALQAFTFGGHQYPLGLNTTITGGKVQEFDPGLPGYVSALQQSPPAFGAQLVRSLVLSQARFIFRDRRTRRQFDAPGLQLLARPWPGATTGELLTRCEWHAGPAGNAYVFRRADRLKLLRPDWMIVVHGSRDDPDGDGWSLDAELLGYLYMPGGRRHDAVPLLPSEVAHWAPIPDPLSPGIGMSWLTPVVREIQGDIAASRHKLKFFENGATPNLVVKGIVADNKTDFDKYVDMMESGHKGLANAYKTLYLTAGADATVVGSNLNDLDLKGLQGSGETRISVASRVPAPVLGISEGLAGSSLNAGNFGQARRNMADIWLYPTLMDLCGSLEHVVDVPNDDAELWFDTVDMPFVREDEKDAADIRYRDSQTVRNLTDAGFEPDAAVAYVQSRGDISSLVGQHTGLFSVQLQKPGAEAGARSMTVSDPNLLAALVADGWTVVRELPPAA